MTVRPRPRPVDPSFPFPFRRDELEQDEATFPVAIIYWMLVLFLVAVVSLYYLFTARSSGVLDPTDLFLGALIALFCLPVLQVVASLLALIVAAVFYADKATALIRVGKITLWSFVGTMIGILIMVGLCGAMGLLGGMNR
jgi:hypothetical protein